MKIIDILSYDHRKSWPKNYELSVLDTIIVVQIKNIVWRLMVAMPINVLVNHLHLRCLELFTSEATILWVDLWNMLSYL